jgi:hypothetical protein
MKLAQKILEYFNEENIMKACKDLNCDSSMEEIEAVAKKSGHEVASIKKIAKGKKKMGEAVNVSDIIKTVISTDWSKDNESQMKVLQLMKGIATSDDPKSNKFMKAIDTFTSGLDPKDF